MKHMKKLASLLLALTLVFALAVTAAADEGESETPSTYSLTIKGTKTGHTYNVYQIFTGDISGTSPNYVLSNVKYGQNYIPDGKNKGDTVADAELASITDANDFAQNVNLIGDVFKTVSSSDGNTEISGLPAGYYLVKDSTKVAGADAATKFILQVVGNTEVAVKSDVPTVEKKVKENAKTVTGNNDVRIPGYTLPDKYNDVADYNIGDSVPFQLIGTLPSNYGDYTTYKYYFHDTLSSGLTYNNDAKVTVDGKDITNSFSIACNSGSLEIKCEDLKTIEGVTLTKDSYIVVDYTATLNPNAVIGLEGNPNEVTLEFSNNPNAGGEGDTGTTPEDKVIVFTYELDVTKIDGATKESETPTKLKDAKFKLHNANNKWVIVDTNSKVTGWSDTEEGGSTLTSNTDGLFKVIGLDDGTYGLKETEAPAGYNLLANEIELKISATTANGQAWNGTASAALTALQIQIGGKTTDGNMSTGVVSATVENNAGTQLPSTGGMGTTLFYVLGSILAVGAIVLLVTKKRMNSAE
ncbi:MAG: isopeptide-forming domain-containing fimbrial protein [Faecousia sp.]